MTTKRNDAERQNTHNPKPAFESPCPDILITPIKVALHRKGNNPIFGELGIHISVEDEAAGPFIVIESNEGQENGLRIDMDELEVAVVVARQLLAGFHNAVGSSK